MAEMNIEPGKTRIGWIGLGVMGRSMCAHVMDHGFSMTVFTRTRATAASVLEKGALWAASPKAVAEQSDVVFSIVGFPHDVREVILGEHGALAGCRPGNVLVDIDRLDRTGRDGPQHVRDHQRSTRPRGPGGWPALTRRCPGAMSEPARRSCRS